MPLSAKTFAAFFILFFLWGSTLSPVYAMAGKPKADQGKIKNEKPEDLPLFPKFKKKGVWLNTAPLGRHFFDDKLTLVYFWDYTSINCIREMDRLKNWYDRYHPYGLSMIWVHAPEFDFAGKPENVASALRYFDIHYPVFLDNEFKLWEAVKVRSWPTKIFVNSDGRIAHSQVGEGGYAKTETRMRELLMQLNPGVVLPPPIFTEEEDTYNFEKCGPMSTETYLGFKRANWWGGKLFNQQWAAPGEPVIYKDRGERSERGFFAEGPWINHEDALEHARQTKKLSDYVGVVYVGREVYALLHAAPDAKTSPIYVFRDDAPLPEDKRGRDIKTDDNGQTYFEIREPRLYYLIQGEDSDPHEIKLLVVQAGVSINSFSFSNECLSQFEHV